VADESLIGWTKLTVSVYSTSESAPSKIQRSPLTAAATAPPAQARVENARPAGANPIAAGTACTANANALCLNGGRFQVRVAWRVPSQGTIGVAQATPLTGDTSHFWFFTPNNVELIVKVVDGRSVNGRFWAFSGALSDAEYTITVTDTVSGQIRTYANPSGSLVSLADTSAF
jgi:hypothetical protein